MINISIINTLPFSDDSYKVEKWSMYEGIRAKNVIYFSWVT